MRNKRLKMATKRIKVTKTGKILRRKSAQGHGQTKDPSKRIRRRKGDFGFDSTLAKKIKNKYI